MSVVVKGHVIFSYFPCFATYSSQKVSTSYNITESGGMQDSEYSEVENVYKEGYAEELVIIFG